MKNKYPLYELSSDQFESLCFDLLSRKYVSVDFGKLDISQQKDVGFDFLGKKKDSIKQHKIAVEVKHRSYIDPKKLKFSFEKNANYFSDFDEVVLITSSPLTSDHKNIISLPSLKKLGFNITLMGQNDIIELLNNNKDIAEKYFKNIREKIRKRDFTKYISLLGAISSIIIFLIIVFSENIDPKKTSLNNQIDIVENALSDIDNLEKSLINLKNELDETSIESEKIKREYEEALKLKTITDEQLQQIKKAVSSQSKIDVFINYFLGFLLGAASSILGAIIYERMKRMRALRGN